jgi:sugar (pentulose or hexulose) kinase
MHERAAIFFGLSLEKHRGDMIRSILEGCGYALHQLIGIAESVTGKKDRAAGLRWARREKSLLWAQIKAEQSPAFDFEDQ